MRLKVPFTRRQWMSVSPSIFVFMSGGMKIMETLITSYVSDSFNVMSSWFFGCIIGGFLGALGMEYFPKKLFYILASCLVIVGGIICASVPIVAPLIAAGYLDGIGFGIATLLTIVVGGENSNSNHRGKVVSLDQFGIAIGILTFTIIDTIYVEFFGFDTEWSIPETIGIMSTLFGLGGLICCYYTIETPVFHLMRCDEGSALETIQFLHKESSPSPNSCITLNSLRQYVHEDRVRSKTTGILQGLTPLVKLIFLRSIMTLTFANPIPATYEYVAFYGFQVSWVSIFFGLARLLGALLSNIVLIDRIGRKVTLLGSCLAIGVLFALISSFIECTTFHGDCTPFERPDLMSLMASLFIILEFFCGVGQGVVTVYMSEAFAPFSKGLFVFIIMLAENAFVILTYGVIMSDKGFSDLAFFITLSVLFFSAFVMVFMTMPETRGVGLRATRERLRKKINIGF
ncbi:hypothetical protein ACFFRR_010402 [Megaselia abdita]